MRGIFITGTSTEVGKTHVGVLLARQLRKKNIKVVPRKPIESGCVRVGDELVPKDATALKEAASYEGPLSEVCPYRFEPPISPARAAHLANKVLTTEQLAEICTVNNDEDFVIVEGAGGLYSPLAENGLNADLAMALGLPILLVAEDNLGCLSQVLLNAEAIKVRGLQLAAVILNTLREGNHSLMDNASDLRDRIECPLFSMPYDKNRTSLPDGLLEHIIKVPHTKVTQLVK